jgi:hypothetical protein
MNDEIFKDVRDSLKRKPPIFEVHILEIDDDFNSEFVLMLWNVLKNRDPVTKLHVHVHSSIYNATLLLLLVADRLILRPYTWLYLESPKRILDNIGEDMSNDAVTQRFNAPPVRSAFVTNHLNVCKIICEYLPVEDIADRRFQLEGLKDYLISEDDQKALDMIFNP